VSSLTVDLDAVTRVLERVGRDVILPRFRNLATAEIVQKITPGYPDDLVTVVDHEAERWLIEGLTSVLPADVIGEELAHGDPDVLSRLESDRACWLIDPIDGTKNFARGDDRFGIMVSLVDRGVTRAAWIVMPARGHAYVAEQGSGAFLDGARLQVPGRHAGGPLRGTFSIRFMPDDLRDTIMAQVADRYEPGPFSGCSAIDYMAVLQGDGDFLVYYRLLPWDHAAPALILTEAGGRVEHADGTAYGPRSRNQLTIVGRDVGVAAVVRGWVEAPAIL
jgi:fructose-1,6-bisphosphatase/inositol monophosphatase family enzyme